jgi:hypothetical protein
LQDVGSNIGVQVRKVFEPELYEFAPVLPIFDRYLGSPDERKVDSGLCVFGFEANPTHAARLAELQECYLSRGWRVQFFVPAAVGVTEGNISFYTDNDKEYNEWGASIFDVYKTSDMKVTVPQVDLARFILDQIHGRVIPPANASARAPSVLMKMDVEGTELMLVPRLLEEGIFCKGIVDFCFMEWHKRLIPPEQADNYEAVQKSVENHTSNTLTCAHKGPTEISTLDDESYAKGNRYLPKGCKTEYHFH